MRRHKQQLEKTDCEEVLKNEKRGTLALNGDNGYPYAIPINYIYDRSGHIYFHGARSGHKIDAIKTSDKACFTVWEQGKQREDWSYYVRSVVVFGRLHLSELNEESLERARRLAYKYYPEGSEEEIENEIKCYTSSLQMYDLEIEHMTGKLVHEK